MPLNLRALLSLFALLVSLAFTTSAHACACHGGSGACTCSGQCTCGSANSGSGAGGSGGPVELTPAQLNAMPAPEAGVVDIAMADYLFTPAYVTVAPGTTVRWTNLDGDPHNIIEHNGVFKTTDDVDFGGSFSYQFDADALGEYNYVCTIHQGMTGTINVSTLAAPEPGVLSMMCAAPLALRRRSGLR